jgi:hypothetical protein
LAVVKITLLQCLGHSAAADELVYILASFTSVPENRNELDKYLEWLRYLEYLDDLMYLDN